MCSRVGVSASIGVCVCACVCYDYDDYDGRSSDGVFGGILVIVKRGNIRFWAFGPSSYIALLVFSGNINLDCYYYCCYYCC